MFTLVSIPLSTGKIHTALSGISFHKHWKVALFHWALGGFICNGAITAHRSKLMSTTLGAVFIRALSCLMVI